MKATIEGIICQKEITLLEKLGGTSIIYQYSSNLTIVDNANTGVLWALNEISEASTVPRQVKLFKRYKEKFVEEKAS